MIVVLAMFALGLCCGFALRRRPKAIRFAGRMTDGCVWLLLFLLGGALGANPDMAESAFVWGRDAVVISAAAVAGSVAVVRLLGRIISPAGPGERA